MPFRLSDRKAWRGQVRIQGKLYRADFPTRHQAADWEARRRQELQQETQSKTRTGMDLVDFCNRYLDDARLRFVPKTYDNKKRVCRRLTEYIGNIPVDHVTPEMINKYLAEQAGIQSSARYNEDYKHLRAMWTWGVDILGLQGNPVAKLKRLPHDRAPQYTPPTADILKVLTAANREEKVFLKCYLLTGARRSEIFRWTWLEDVNFAKREIRLGTRKTRDGSMHYEWLPMNEELYQELWWWYKQSPVKGTAYVFVSTSNRHYGHPFTTRRQFMKGLCQRAGVKPFGFHALRRYVASYLADDQKVSAKTIQRILRHKQLSTTERYIQNINHDLAATMDLLKIKSSQEQLTNNGSEVGNSE